MADTPSTHASHDRLRSRDERRQRRRHLRLRRRPARDRRRCSLHRRGCCSCSSRRAKRARRDRRSFRWRLDQEAALPPEPRLQTNPRQDLRDLRSAEDACSTATAGWTRTRASCAFRSSEAMKLTVQRGLPARQESRTMNVRLATTVVRNRCVRRGPAWPRSSACRRGASDAPRWRARRLSATSRSPAWRRRRCPRRCARSDSIRTSTSRSRSTRCSRTKPAAPSRSATTSAHGRS